MTLSFFRALNPASKNSGIAYPSNTVVKGMAGIEITDNTVSEHFKYAAWQQTETIGISDIFNLLVGKHYVFSYLGVCSKGILDYLIFPLVARALVNQFDHKNIFMAALAYSIALPLEITRFTLGIALTLIIAPVVALVNLLKSCLPGEEQSEEVFSEINALN